MNSLDSPFVPIRQVERETGITKETLRKWESRYGFPLPHRDSNGERLYSPEDIHRLRLISGLVSGGHRPSEVVRLSREELVLLHAKYTDTIVPSAAPGLLGRVLARLQIGDAQGLRQELETVLMQKGLNAFIEDTLPALIDGIGKHWEGGSLAIHQEHLFSEILRSTLQNATHRLRCAPKGPRVLMGTAPEEQHGIGLIMLQSLLTLEGAQCINLGTQVPLIELVGSAQSYCADIVAVSFSLAYTSRRIAPFVLELRSALPAKMALWAGGAGVDRLRSNWPGVSRFDRIGIAATAIKGSLNLEM